MEESMIDSHLLHVSSYKHYTIVTSDGNLDYELRYTQIGIHEIVMAILLKMNNIPKQNLYVMTNAYSNYNNVDDISQIDTDNKY